MSHPLTTIYRVKLAFHQHNSFPVIQAQNASAADGFDVPTRLKHVQDTPKRHAEFVGNHARGP
jgi:hypothetical protein